MAEAPHLMGIDFGTGGVRVGLFDRQGSPAVFHAVELPTHHPRPGWAEQDPDGWWSCLARASRGALERCGVPATEIAGISVDATASTVVATDADGRPLRPAIMWMDVRADWAIQRLTGEAATSVNTASGKYYDDRAEGGFPAGLLYPATRDVMHQVTSHVAGAAGASGG